MRLHLAGGPVENTVDCTSDIVHLKGEGVSREHRLPSISCLSSTHVRTMRNPSSDKSQALAVGQFWHVLDYYVARRYVQGTDSVHQVNHTTVNFKRESQVS